MVVTLDCAHCGAVLRSSPRVAPGKRIQCGVCRTIFPVGLTPDLFASTLIAGDDDEGSGGGGKSGGGDDDESEAADGEDESEDDDEEEDDGKGGKKKKKKGKVEARGGCGFMTYLIAAGVLLSCCVCIGIGTSLGIIKGPTPASVVGAWEAKDNDGAEIALNLRDGGAGAYTKAGKGQDLKWTTSDPKTLELEMSDSANKLWTNEAKSRFTYDMVAGKLALTHATPGGRAVTFTKAIEKVEAKDDKSEEPKDDKKGKTSTGKKKR